MKHLNVSESFLQSTIARCTLFALGILITVTHESRAGENECGIFAIDSLIRVGQQIARPSLISPVIISRTTSYLNYKVHYTTSTGGTYNDASTSTWANAVADYVTEALQSFSNQGWLMPPNDAGRGEDDPDTFYDIYICNSIARYRYIGYTPPEDPSPNPYPEGYTSWIAIYKEDPGDFPEISSFDRLKALVAHELHRDAEYPETSGVGILYSRRISITQRVIDKDKTLAQKKLQRKTILLIDDEQEWLNVMSQALAQEPYNVITAESGETALKKLEKNAPRFDSLRRPHAHYERLRPV